MTKPFDYTLPVEYSFAVSPHFDEVSLYFHDTVLHTEFVKFAEDGPDEEVFRTLHRKAMIHTNMVSRLKLLSEKEDFKFVFNLTSRQEHYKLP